MGLKVFPLHHHQARNKRKQFSLFKISNIPDTKHYLFHLSPHAPAMLFKVQPVVEFTANPSEPK